METLLIDDDEENKCITDSYDIAQYVGRAYIIMGALLTSQQLESKYATETKSIFVGTSKVTGEAMSVGRAYSRFIEQWVGSVIFYLYHAEYLAG